MNDRITGLVAATHTPFAEDGSLNLAVVERQAEHLLQQGVSTVFIGGTTGESHSLTQDERLRLADRWLSLSRAEPRLQVVVHVGSNCLTDARVIAEQAGRLGARAISALSPSYFKPASVTSLLEWCSTIAAEAPDTPFFYYDIPEMTGVRLPMPEFLERALATIPNFVGLKFSNTDLVSLQECLAIRSPSPQILWGVDECLLAALAMGVDGAVGSTYNFAAPLYQRLIQAFHRGDLATARSEQVRSVRLVGVLARHGFMASAKHLMTRLGVQVGPPRPPHSPLSTVQARELDRDLTEYLS